MIDDGRGRIDYDETGSGPTLVLVPGSFSTRSAWREVAAALGGRYRVVTTSLLGYGTTDERRTAQEVSIAREVEIVEAVIARAGPPVHLVGHSFGGAVCAEVAARRVVPLCSLALIEPTVFGLLHRSGQHALYREVTTMRDAYFQAFERGEKEAARHVIDFYGGRGSFDALPERMRAYVMATTPTNVLDWRTAFEAPLPVWSGGAVPGLVLRGDRGHPAMARCAELVAAAMPAASLVTVEGAGHFMIATHPREVARLVGAAVEANIPAGPDTHELWSCEP